jgi:septal ring factor EnvC (AmiA/AmiB activator)
MNPDTNMTTSNPAPAADSSIDQSQVNQQLRDAIVAKKEAQIEAWNRQIEKLQQDLQSVAGDVRAATEQRLAELREARDRAQAQLERLRQATRESWQEILRQSDELFQDLARRFHEFASEGN